MSTNLMNDAMKSALVLVGSSSFLRSERSPYSGLPTPVEA
jgi:hypothetical protein